MYSDYDDIPLEHIHHGHNYEQPSERGIQLQPDHTAIDLYVEPDDRLYQHSDVDISTSDVDVDYVNGTDLADGLPSRQIGALAHKSIGSGIRQRKLSTNKTKSRTQRPKHLPNSWRNDPQQFNNQIITSWRTEDEENGDEEEDEVKKARRIEELRDMTINLTKKIELRKELRQAATIKQGDKKSRGIGCWRSMKYTWTIRREHAKSAIVSAVRSLGLWEGHLKAFASHFGTDVTAYFLFLRWLFLANLFIGPLILVFVFTPQMLAQYLKSSTTNTTVYITVTGITSNSYRVLENATGVEFFTGKGPHPSSAFNNSGMYYGDYTSLIISSTSGGTVYEYDMRIAYLVTYAAYFFVFFLVIAISVAKSYRKNFIESSDKFTFQYVLNILDGWDHMIDAAKTARMKKMNIYRDLREFCSSKRQPEVISNCCEKFGVWIFRAGGLFIMTAAVVGSGVAVYFSQEDLGKPKDSEPLEEFKDREPLLPDLLLPVIVTALNTFVPFLFSVMASFLRFTNPKSVVYLTLVMTMLLYFATLGVYFLVTMPIKWSETPKSQVTDCWETALGEKTYSFVVIDFLFGLLFTLVSEVFYRMVTQLCCRRLEDKKQSEGKSIHPEFNIARNTMTIIYNQFLLWLGVYYCPLLTVAVVIKLWMIFYVKRITVMNACIPTKKPWRAAKMHTVFLGLLFVCSIVCAIMFAVAITVMKPSLTCGPFANEISAVTVVGKLLAGASGSKVFEIVISPGVVLGVIVILCVIVHYVRVTSAGRKKLVSLLKIQITLESKDKAFLRHMLDEVQKHKSSRQEVRQCNCDGACNCRNGTNVSRMDQVPNLRPDIAARRNRRVFAKQKSSTSTLNADSTVSFGYREDLSRGEEPRKRATTDSTVDERRAHSNQQQGDSRSTSSIALGHRAGQSAADDRTRRGNESYTDSVERF